MEHVIRISGPALVPGRFDGEVMHRLLHVLVEGTRRAVRLVSQGRSRSPAVKPGWLRRGAAFDLLPTSDLAAHEFRVEARPLCEVDPDEWRQLELFAGRETGTRAGIELFEDALEAALKGQADSDLLDEGMLDGVLRFDRLFRLGVERVEFVNGRTVPLERSDLSPVKTMAEHTPRPHHVRVSGHLDAIQESGHRFKMRLASGMLLSGVAEKVPSDVLRRLWGTDVVVEGRAVFRPTGVAGRVDADRVAPVTDVDRRVFSGDPQPLFGLRTDVRRLHQPQGPEDGVNAIFGKWPGDETDEEIAAIIKEIS